MIIVINHYVKTHFLSFAFLMIVPFISYGKHNIVEVFKKNNWTMPDPFDYKNYAYHLNEVWWGNFGYIMSPIVMGTIGYCFNKNVQASLCFGCLGSFGCWIYSYKNLKKAKALIEGVLDINTRQKMRSELRWQVFDGIASGVTIVGLVYGAKCYFLDKK